MQFICLNLQSLPLERANEVVPTPSRILSDTAFTVTDRVGPTVILTRYFEVPEGTDYAKRTANIRRKLRGPMSEDPAPLYFGPFSEETQQNRLDHVAEATTSLFAARSTWTDGRTQATEEFSLFHARTPDEAAQIITEFTLARSGLPREDVTIELDNTGLAGVNGSYPTFAMNKTSKLDWDGFITDQLLPQPIARVDEPPPQES